MTKQQEIEKGMFKIVEQGQRLMGTPDGYPGVIAYKLLNYLRLNDVVIKVDRELPDTFDHKMIRVEVPSWAKQFLKDAGYVAVEPLIKE